MKLPVDRKQWLLHLAIVVVIMLAAGPEIIAAVEMTTLLEMLGAALFLTAFWSGARLMLLNLARDAREMFAPDLHVAVLRNGTAIERGAIGVWLFANAFWMSIHAAILAVFFHYLFL